FFLFYSPPSPPNLHSFPTRRSSDLINATRYAFRFTLLGREPRGDRMLEKYELSPNPTFKPTSRFTAILTRVHGYVWIDETAGELDRKSTRLNSSHLGISYAVFCLKK